MEKRLSNIFKTSNVAKLTKAILESSYRKLLYFLKAVECWPTFYIEIGITLTIFLEKLQNRTFEKAHRSLSKHANIFINRATHYKITAIEKKKKKLKFFGGSFSKTKIADILNFQWISYLGKGLSYLKRWGIRVKYCQNYGPSKLLLHFIEYHPDQLNNNHTKIVVKLIIQFFESRYQKKYLVKVWSFLLHPLQNDGPVKSLRNWTETILANIFKLHEYQTFGLMKMHNMSKIQFLKKLGLRWTGHRECYFLTFVFSRFPNFKLLSKNLLWISRVFMKFYHVTNIFDLHSFDNETTAIIKAVLAIIKEGFV